MDGITPDYLTFTSPSLYTLQKTLEWHQAQEARSLKRWEEPMFQPTRHIRQIIKIQEFVALAVQAEAALQDTTNSTTMLKTLLGDRWRYIGKAHTASSPMCRTVQNSRLDYVLVELATEVLNKRPVNNELPAVNEYPAYGIRSRSLPQNSPESFYCTRIHRNSFTKLGVQLAQLLGTFRT